VEEVGGVVSADTAQLARLLKDIQQRSRRERGRLVPASPEDVRAAVEAFREKTQQLAFDPASPTTCERCHGGGWEEVIESRTVRIPGPDGSPIEVQREIQVARRCECRQSQPAKPITVFDLPAEFRDARLANYGRRRHDNSHALDAAEQWMRGERRHLYLFGEVGRGKSRLAASLANEAAAIGTGAAFIRVPWMIMLQLRGIDDPARRKEANDLLDRALRTPVVVLDDVAGGEKGSDFTRGLFVTVLDRRFDRELKTIITTNLSLQALSEFYADDRIPSRIAGACGETIEVGGIDGRLSKSAPARRGMRAV
jgi:DNA replication protein DnaC